MRRQLYRSGGITNARQGYGLGSWVKEKIRKIIPNELADVGVLYNKLFAFLVANGAREVADSNQHTHEDGTAHSHPGGDVEHSHNQGETND